MYRLSADYTRRVYKHRIASIGYLDNESLSIAASILDPNPESNAATYRAVDRNSFDPRSDGYAFHAQSSGR